MRDNNYPLQKAYTLRLTGITYLTFGVPAYYQELPNNIVLNYYILFGPVTNTDDSTINSSDSISSMRVTIHSFENEYNTGKALGSITNDVYSRIYPNSQFNLDLSPDNLQMVNTRLASDLTQDYRQAGTRLYIDRIIIFRHKIYHK